MFTQYIATVMESAIIEKIDDPMPFLATVPEFKGVWAQGKTRREALSELQEVLEEWILLKIRKQQFVPTRKSYDLNALLEVA